jgi:N-acetylmuramoyl-L-alanine amidase
VTAGALLWLAAWLAAAFRSETLTVVSLRGERQVAVRLERGWPALAAPELVAALGVEAGVRAGGAASLRLAGRRFDFLLEASYFRFGDQVFALAAPPYVARDTLFLPLQWAIEYLPRLVPDRFRYDPRRVRLEELPAVTADAVAVPAGPAPASDTSDRAAAAQAPPARAPVRRSVTAASGLRLPHVVALDAGHGGPDVGMLGPIRGRKFLREKDVTLAVARDVADELRRRGVGVVLTRNSDTLIALRDRGRIARAQHADLFVSIHVNAANPHWRDAAGARGFETYFLAEAKTEDARRVAQLENESVRFEKDDGAGSDPMRFILNDLQENEHLRESSRLAEIMERTLGQVHPAEARGVKQAGFAVLATSYMPAVLVELGFGSNPDEARYLTGAAGQRRLARGIADAVASYLAEYERRLPATGAGPE